jgi:small GTP-binding protein
MSIEVGKIRNVAVVGHRGTGKTSLVEALLFQAGKTNRLGAIEAGTTVSDWEEDEQRRQMSLSAALVNLEWEGRKINLIDTPGDSGFQADTVASLRVVEGALLVVSGVMGVEVNTARVWNRADELELSRVVFVNMLDRERADFYRVLAAVQEQLSDRCVAIQLPIGAEHELTGVVDLLHNCAYMDPEGGREGDPVAIPDELAPAVEEYRTKLLDAVVETDEALMERYLGGEEIPAADIAAALKNAVTRDEEPGHARAARPDRRGRPEPGEEGLSDRHRREDRGVRVQDGRRPVRGPHLDLPGVRGRGALRHDARQPPRPLEGAPRLARLARREGAQQGRQLRHGRPRGSREAEGRADGRRAR